MATLASLAADLGIEVKNVSGGVVMSDSAKKAQSLNALGKFTNHDWNGFAAQEVHVEIVPMFSMRAVPGLSAASTDGGDDTTTSTAVAYGPFAPGIPIDVPLWLALYLRETETCRIRAPHFLQLDYLRGVLERDRASDQAYEELPYYFFECAEQILSVARDDIPSLTEVIHLVKEIAATRRHKLSKTVASFQHGASLVVPGLRLTNFASTEVEYLRATLINVFDRAEALEQRSQGMNAPDVVAGPPSSASSSSGGGSSSDNTSASSRSSGGFGSGTTVSSATRTTGSGSHHTPSSSTGWTTSTSGSRTSGVADGAEAGGGDAVSRASDNTDRMLQYTAAAAPANYGGADYDTGGDFNVSQSTQGSATTEGGVNSNPSQTSDDSSSSNADFTPVPSAPQQPVPKRRRTLRQT